MDYNMLTGDLTQGKTNRLTFSQCACHILLHDKAKMTIGKKHWCKGETVSWLMTSDKLIHLHVRCSDKAKMTIYHSEEA